MSTFDQFNNKSLYNVSSNIKSFSPQIPEKNAFDNVPNLLFISCFDFGSRELGMNHLQSLKNQGIDNYMAFIADLATYDLVKKHGFHCTLIEDTNKSYFKEQKHFGTPNFTEFVFLRYKFIHESLKKYNAVWYLDVDTVVLYNLNEIYKEYVGNGYDIIFQDDIHQVQNCTGCQLYFSSQKTLDMSIHIYKGMNNQMPDQHYVNFFLQANPGVFKTTMFDKYQFPNGLLYFDEVDLINLSSEFREQKNKYNEFHRNNNQKIAFIHANWMVGIDTKINAMKKKGHWYI
jgi:hypothetical protein